MNFNLSFSNERRSMPIVRALAREALQQLPLAAADAAELEKLLLGAVENAVAHAYPDGQEGSIKLTIRETHGRLELRVRDYGMPVDVEVLERRLQQPDESATLFGVHHTSLTDEMHWLSFGPEGKALQIIKWLHENHIADYAESGTLESFRDDAPPAKRQQYTIRRMRSEEAVLTSQLMYRAYGNSYFNPDVYYPERLAAQNANGSVLSFVAVAQDGAIAGHYALEMNQEGPVAEGGQAVVDPAHRGRGLLDRMKEAALEQARQLDLLGWYADAVTVHTLTQKSNVSHGGRLTAVNLGVAPKSEVFRGIGGEQPQRVTCLLYFHWLTQPALRTVHVPAQHRPLVAAIYDNLQCPVRFGDGDAPSGKGALCVKTDPGAKAFVRAEQLGADTVAAVRHAKRELVERSRVEVVFAELPLEDPAACHVALELESEGFAFAGVAPHFSTRGDTLRLVYLVEPLAREPIQTFDDFAGRLVDYVLSEQSRVRSDW